MQERQLEHDKDRIERELVAKYHAGELVVNESAPPEKRVRFDAAETDSAVIHGPRRRLNIGSVSATAEVVSFLLWFLIMYRVFTFQFRQRLHTLTDGKKLLQELVQAKRPPRVDRTGVQHHHIVFDTIDLMMIRLALLMEV